MYRKIIFQNLCILIAAGLSFSSLLRAQQLPAQLEQLRAQAQTTTTNSAQALSPAMVSGSTQSIQSEALDDSRSMGQFSQNSRTGVVFPGEVNFNDVFPLQSPLENPPFAANLFIGGFESERSDGLTTNYTITPGDKVSVRLWGAVNYADVLTVDNQGNIFVPSIGPIALGGVAANNVNTIVTQTINRVYTSDVNVYVNLLSATPVAVFVTGPVIRPGQYAGQSSDSVLYYLKRSGGIDFTRGSFRSIDIIRNNTVISSIDLYDFFTKGQMASIAFQDGDTILVHSINETITVTDGARNSFTFEFNQDTLLGQSLTEIAKPSKNTTHVNLSGIRNGASFSQYLPLKDFNSEQLFEGDRIAFVEDIDAALFSISIVGNTKGPSTFVVRNGTRLKDLLAYVAVDNSVVDLKGIHLLRESVAAQQKEIIEQALQRLERSVFTAPISSTGEGAIRVQEAQLVNDFIARARRVTPLGKVVVSEAGNVANIILEAGDRIVIPAMTDLIHVGGEVLMPQSLVFNSDARVEDYIAWSGGLTERADTKRILIIKVNGMMDFYSSKQSYWLSEPKHSSLAAGDQIIILPEIDVKSLQAIKDITQIIYQIAVAANVALN
jgi:protein involved in polysaccharide export with SLBB domain